MGKRLTQTARLLLSAGLLLLVLLWLYETGWLFGRDTTGSLSCAEYRENINTLYTLIPDNTTPEARCRMTPARCGPTGLIFNPAGMQTYYYRSQCYQELAIASLNEAHCAAVMERPSLLFNGAFFSQQACLAKVRQARADRAAPRVGPGAIARIETLMAAFDREQNLSVTLTLSPDRPVYGIYAIATTAHLETDNAGSTAGAAVTVALNARHPAITRDRRYARLLPIGDELLQLTAAFGVPASLTYRADAGQLVDYLKRGAGRRFTLAVRLQFLESAIGALADPALRRDVYISEKVLPLMAPEAGLRQHGS